MEHTRVIGQSIAHYKITAKLGAGGMGEVYRATDTKLRRDVALKILPAEMARDAQRLARFQREAQAIASLNHPHIVTIFSVEEAGGVHFLTMELIEGQPLDRCIPQGGLMLRQLVELATPLAEALGAAHEKGIVHRDLKPANVMVTSEGRVKVLDFGLAKEIHAGGSSDATLSSAGHTQEGVVMGTPAYMSPEQVTGRALDHRTDIFSLGILLYEMATGRRPFHGRSSAELASSILRDAPPAVTSLRGDLSDDLARIIRRCLEKDPRDRLQTALDVRNELRDLTRRMSPATGSARTGSSVSSVAGGEPRGVVVVLPFVNRSPDPDNEYFSDGLTEEIISSLSRIEALKVISRNSSMALKGTASNTPSIARQLGATHVVSGSVRRAGDALRVTAELVEAASDTLLWSEKYAGTMADVFGIQEEIASKIVDALKVKLSDSGEQRAVHRPIEDVTAYDYYLRARQELYAWSPEAQDRALRMVDQALEIVGENSLLLATKGQVSWSRVNVMLGGDERNLDEATECARRALALDPNDYLGLFLRGIVAGIRGQTARALHDIHRAHRLRPSDPNVLAEMCRFANASGVDIQDYVDKLVRIDPLTPVTWLVVSMTHSVNERIEQLVAPARRAVELTHRISFLHIVAAWQMAAAGQRDEAIHLLQRAGKELDSPLHRSWALFMCYAVEGDAERCTVQMTPQLEQAAGMTDIVAISIADCYSLIGRNDEALQWIRIGMNHGFINYPFLSTYDPLLANLRSDSRFGPLMEEVKGKWEALAQDLPQPLRALKPPPAAM